MTKTGERLYVTWVGSRNNNLDHAVTDEESVSRLAENRGVYRSVCAEEFLPTAMERAPLPPCPRCVALVRTRLGMAELESPGITRKRGLLSRLHYRGRRG